LRWNAFKHERYGRRPLRIDAHQHFWLYNPREYGWISDAMQSLRRDFLPEDLWREQACAGFAGAVTVQARQSLAETEWLLHLADRHESIKGVVGWVDLCSPDVREQLARFAAHPKLVGVRHVVQDEPDDAYMLRPDFLAGLACLSEFHLTYDLLLYPRHLPVACRVVERFPDQRFVLDHIAKPNIRDGAIAGWAADLRALAQFANVWCKLSGMVTEADWHAWRPEDFRPYLDVVWEAFGPDRLMIGSDWPVCTVAGSYRDVLQIVVDYLQEYPEEEREKVLGSNATAFYGLQA
jgi:L-fuconolactonase